MNSGSAVKRRREGALERLKKAGSTDAGAIKEINTLQTRITSNSKHRKYLGRKSGTPKVTQPTGPQDEVRD